MDSHPEGGIPIDTRISGDDHGFRGMLRQEQAGDENITRVAGEVESNNRHGQSQRLLGGLSQEERSTTNGSVPTSPMNDLGGRDQEGTRDLPIREKPRVNTGSESRKPTQRICRKCGEPLTGQFVRALEGTFHLDCFRCQVCRGVSSTLRGLI